MLEAGSEGRRGLTKWGSQRSFALRRALRTVGQSSGESVVRLMRSLARAARGAPW
jgi:hypothetical protein